MKFGEVTTKARIEHDAIVNRYKDVPVELDGVESVDVNELKETFHVDGYIVVTKPDMVKNDEGVWEQKTSKKGALLTITLVYCRCRTDDKTFYFCTKSPKMLDQLFQDPEKTTEEDGMNGKITVCRMDEPIEDLMKIDWVEVEYRNKKKYNQPILAVAEVAD